MKLMRSLIYGCLHCDNQETFCGISMDSIVKKARKAGWVAGTLGLSCPSCANHNKQTLPNIEHITATPLDASKITAVPMVSAERGEDVNT